MKNRKGFIFILLAGSLWGTIGLFSKILNTYGISSSASAFVRIFSASVILMLYILLKNRKMFRISRNGLICAFINGAVGQALYNICYTSSVNCAGVAVSSVLLYLSPVFVFLFSLVFGDETSAAYKLPGIILNIAGCALAAGVSGAMNFAGIISLVPGILSALAYAFMTIWSSKCLKDTDKLTFLFYSMLSGSICLLTTSPLSEIVPVLEMKMLFVSCAYGLFTTVIPYLLYYSGLSVIEDLSGVPVIASVEVVVASVIGIFLFGEEAGITKTAGIVLVLLSIVLINLKALLNMEKHRSPF